MKSRIANILKILQQFVPCTQTIVMLSVPSDKCNVLVYVHFFFFFLASEIILGYLVHVAFIYIENIQTFTSVPFR